MAFKHDGYTLYARTVRTKSGSESTVYFFAKSKAENARPVDLPDGFRVDVEPHTGLPRLVPGEPSAGAKGIEKSALQSATQATGKKKTAKKKAAAKKNTASVKPSRKKSASTKSTRKAGASRKTGRAASATKSPSTGERSTSHRAARSRSRRKRGED